MATSTNSQPDLKICPYNSHHKVKMSRFFQHLSTCGRQYPHIKLQVCPFNACHRVLEQDFPDHKINCPDNLSALRNFYVNSQPKVATDTMDMKIGVNRNTAIIKEDNEEDDDPWRDEYIKPESMTAKNYDMLGENITAEWLIKKRFDENKNEHKKFPDSIFTQKMTQEERRKYNMMCVQKTKEMKGSAKEQEEADEEPVYHPNSLCSSLVSDDGPNMMLMKKRKMEEDEDSAVRKPNTMPFFKLTGIDRGRCIGVGRGRGRGRDDANGASQ